MEYTILKAVKEDEIIGSVRAYCENETVYIGKLMVHPTYRKQGVGTRLLEAIEECYINKRYELFTSTRSQKNIQMYERHGYTVYKEKQITQELQLVYLEK